MIRNDTDLPVTPPAGVSFPTPSSRLKERTFAESTYTSSDDTSNNLFLSVADQRDWDARLDDRVSVVRGERGDGERRRMRIANRSSKPTLLTS